MTVLATLSVIGWTWSRCTAIFFQILVIPRSQPCILEGEQLWTISSTVQDATSLLIEEVGACDVELRGQGLLLVMALYSCKLFPGTRGFAGEGLKLTGSLSLLSEDILWSMNGLPNVIMPSDHLSLLAKFQMDLGWVEELMDTRDCNYFCSILFGKLFKRSFYFWFRTIVFEERGSSVFFRTAATYT